MKKKDCIGKCVVLRKVDYNGLIEYERHIVKKIKNSILIDKFGYEICSLQDIEVHTSTDQYKDVYYELV